MTQKVLQSLVDFIFASASDLWNANDDTKPISSLSMKNAGGFIELTDGTTITPNIAAGRNFTLTIGGNRTMANLGNISDGVSGVILITQDGTGGRTLSFSSNWKFANGVPSLSTAAGAVDMIAYVVRSPFTYATLVKGFA